MRSASKIDIPTRPRLILLDLMGAGYDAYIVGGCVRDSLLNRKPHDWDICTNAAPDQVKKVMHSRGYQTFDTGIKHGTVTVVRQDENFEITTFRVDGEYTDNRRPDRVEFTGNIIEDLSRRDFTINAIAYTDDGRFVDPWNGSYDLHAGIIRCVRNPDDRFKEDALRIMRALRFASTYGFRIEKETAAAIHRNKDLLKNISAERIQSELCKMLCGKGVLDILLEYKDVMSVIIPELEPCIGFQQNNPYHRYDVYDHIAHAVSKYKGNDISIKMTLLLHDIGKPECYVVDDEGTGHFYEHCVASMRIAKDVMARLRFDNRTRDEVVDLVLYHDADINPSVRSVRRWLNKVGADIFNKLHQVRIADVYAQSGLNRDERISDCDKAYGIAQYVVAEQQCFTLKDLDINGHDILELGAEPGPQVGRVLNHLLDRVLDDEIENTYPALREETLRFLKGD